MTTNQHAKITITLGQNGNYVSVLKFCKRIVEAATDVLNADELRDIETAYNTLMNHMQQPPRESGELT